MTHSPLDAAPLPDVPSWTKIWAEFVVFLPSRRHFPFNWFNEQFRLPNDAARPPRCRFDSYCALSGRNIGSSSWSALLPAALFPLTTLRFGLLILSGHKNADSHLIGSTKRFVFQLMPLTP
ncbi:hypothetical protein ACMD2_19552 [Ananas comosus]|uniref:Uncharacterized protein n=1 Tax=Ananas comosus TaxID=4615 RepID=A0A199UIH9_ANACO|nr:hypothetical protein ACMD2_19552 [Ananas comosus]